MARVASKLVVPGPGPRLQPPANDVPYGALYLASDPRRHLENLTRGRGWSSRVLPQDAVEASLDRPRGLGGQIIGRQPVSLRQRGRHRRSCPRRGQEMSAARCRRLGRSRLPKGLVMHGAIAYLPPCRKGSSKGADGPTGVYIRVFTFSGSESKVHTSYIL